MPSPRSLEGGRIVAAARGGQQAGSSKVSRRSRKPGVAHAPREAEQQCVVREANEAVSLLRRTPGPGAQAQRLTLRCECGDAGCVACVSLTRAEYEAVRAYGSHFAVGVNHENPEDACV